MEADQPQRLQKLLASCGIASRRIVEQMITAKRIKVNGEIANLGDKASISDEIKLDDVSVPLAVDLEW